MKRITTYLTAGLLIIGVVAPGWAQYDARQWPAYPYDAAIDIQKDLPNIRKPKGMYKFVPQEYPPEAYKEYSGRRSILNAAGIELVSVSPYILDQTETWIAINPTDSDNIIAGSNDSRFNTQGNYHMIAYWSTDGGNTWGETMLPAVPADLVDDVTSRATNFDPGIDFDSRGWAYYVFGKTQTNGDDLEGDNGIFVCVSKDGGQSWGEAIPVTLNVAADNVFDDKFLITADKDPDSEFADNVYVVWTRFNRSAGQSNQIMLGRAERRDNAETWALTPIPIGGSGSSIQSPLAAIGPDGELYVTWRSTSGGSQTRAMFQSSADGGRNWRWGTARVAQTVQTTGVTNSESGRFVLADKAGMRISSYPTIAVDVNPDSDYHGRIYIVQSGRIRPTDDEHHVLLTWSDNGGEDWTEHVIVDDNDTDRDVFLPNIAVDPSSGAIAVVYYSSQDDETESNTGVNAYVAISNNGGESWRRIRLTDQTFFIDGNSDISRQGPGNNYWGDYTSIDFRDGKVFPCFWIPSGPNGNYRSLDAYTALISSSPNPPTNLEASNSFQNASNVQLTWEDPSETLLGEPLTDFEIEISRRDLESGQTENLGRVDKGVEEYLDQGAVDGRQYVYQILAVTPSNERSGTIDVRLWAGGALEPARPEVVNGEPSAEGVKLNWINPGLHVDESEFHDFERIDVYVDGELVTSIDDAEVIIAGETVSLLLGADKLELNKFHLVQLKAVGKRGDIETSSEFSNEKLVYSGAPYAAASFEENFDDAQNAIPSYTNGGWAVVSNVSNSSPNCITDSPDGDYEKLTLNDYIMAPVTIDASNSSLEWWHMALIDQPTSDFGFVFISKDFGETWDYFAGFDRGNRAGQGVWDGDASESQFVAERRSVAEYIGETIMLRFQLKSNGLIHDDGWYIDDIDFNGDAVSVDERDEDLVGMHLSALYPNPSSGIVNFEYSLVRNDRVRLALYNTMGQQVALILDEAREAGSYPLSYDASVLPNGVYYLRMSVAGQQLTQSISIVK